jgi:hypothetical protein
VVGKKKEKRNISRQQRGGFQAVLCNEERESARENFFFLIFSSSMRLPWMAEQIGWGEESRLPWPS